jgi:hypothetical protein
MHPDDPDRAWDERGEHHEGTDDFDDVDDVYYPGDDGGDFFGYLDEEEARDHDLALEDAESMRRDRERGDSTPWRM